MDLLADLRRELHMGLILITHDLGVVAGVADRIAVMYAGRIVEQADVRTLYSAPAHPYTRGLLASVPAPLPARRRPLHDHAACRRTPPGCPPDARSTPVARTPSGSATRSRRR